MSALSWIRPGAEPTERGGRGRRATLQPVPPTRSNPGKLQRLPFLLVLAGMLGAGMLGLLLLNTTLQNQSFQLREKQVTATSLSYVEADLQYEVDRVSSPRSLAGKATELGMRPNTTPVFLVMPDGRVLGTVTKVEGNGFPGALVKTPGQLALERAAAQEKAAQEKAEREQAAEKKAAEEKAAREKAAREKAAEAKSDRRPGGRASGTQQGSGETRSENDDEEAGQR